MATTDTELIARVLGFVDTAQWAPPPAEAQEWLTKNAIPLKTVEAGNGFEDLEPLRPLLKNTRVVALGEATHGTREFFQMKHRLLEFFVTELGFTHFGIESAFTDATAMDDYVRGGEGTAEEVLKENILGTWDTKEVLELVNWMRAYNDARPDDQQIGFFGFDMQATAAPSHALVEYLENHDLELAKSVGDRLTPLSSFFDSTLYRGAGGGVQTEAKQAIREATQLEAARNADDAAWVRARVNATALAFAQEFASKTLSQEIRDRAMAGITTAFLDAAGDSSKAVLWAHNGHVRRGFLREFAGGRVPAMGRLLGDHFGDAYKVVTFAFNEGEFAAFEMGGTSGSKNFATAPAPSGTLDSALAATGYELAAFDFGAARASGAGDWLSTNPPTKCIGGGSTDDLAARCFVSEDAFEQDVLIFVNKTTGVTRRNVAAPGRPANARPDALKSPSNLDFAVVTDEGAEGWRGSKDFDFTAGTATLLGDKDQQLAQVIEAESLRDKEIIFKARIEAELDGFGNHAHLFVHLRSDEDSGLRFAMTVPNIILQPGGPITKSGTYEVRVAVPADTTTITFGIQRCGKGKLTASELEFAGSAG